MADETSRKEKRLKVLIDENDDDSGVFVPVTTEISFRDPKTNGQEYGFRFDPTKRRKVHTHTVKHANADGSEDDDPTVDVERIEQFSFKDPKTSSQEYTYRIRNDDPPPKTPDGDDGGTKKHRKVQYVRYSQDNDPTSNFWADFELIDEYESKDPKDRSQEKVLRLNNSKNLSDIQVDEDDPYSPKQGFCDPSLEEISGERPYKFDPFKAMVNIGGSEKGFVAASGFWQVSGSNGYFLDEKGSVIGTIPTHGFFPPTDGIPVVSSTHATCSALGVKGKIGYVGYIQDALHGVQSDIGSTIWGIPIAAGVSGWGQITPAGITIAPIAMSSYKEGVFAVYSTAGVDSVVFNTLVHFSPEGVIRWSKLLVSGTAIPGQLNCAVNRDGTVVAVFFSGSWTMKAYSSEGAQLWTKSGLGDIIGSVILSQVATADAFVYASFNGNSVTKAKIKTGQAIWTAAVSNVVGVDIASDGSVYACSDDGSVTRLTWLDSDTGAPSRTITIASDGGFGGAASSTGRCVVSPGKIVAVGHVSANVISSDESEVTTSTSTVYAYKQSTGVPVWQFHYGTLEIIDGTASPGQEVLTVGRSPS